MTMLKGVNKQILEVTNSESQKKKKIIFFVRSSSPVRDSEKLKEEAEKISLNTALKPPKSKITKEKIFSFIAMSGLGALAGCALCFIINDFIL